MLDACVVCSALPLSVRVLAFLLCSQFAVLRLEVEDHADAGEVQTGVEKVADAAQPLEVVSAVAAGPAVGALGSSRPRAS
jgi:hypothetical protein